MGGGADLVSREPLWVPVEVTFEGATWRQVGMRYKGNSSLLGSAPAGNRKLPFRLDFDHFDRDYVELEDQRFFGFEKLTFVSNYGDDSQLRQAFVTWGFAQSGVAVAQASFIRVVVDRGAGDEYWGLYTVVEDPSDAESLRAAYGTSDGNLYKPSGTGADWTRFVREGFRKKTNEREEDWRDVQRAVEALHAFGADPTQRAQFEAVFEVDEFLRQLAVNTVLQNWDGYGQIAHNYYLYADPGRGGRLVWMPWDFNFALGATGGGAGGFGGGGFGGGGTPATATEEFFHARTSTQWPLIRFLLDDEEYRARYRQHLAETLDGPIFTEGEAVLRDWHLRISEHVLAEEEGSRTVTSPEAFAASLDGEAGLIPVLAQRRARLVEALENP